MDDFRYRFVSINYVWSQLTTDFDDPDGLPGTASFVEPARKPVDELSEFDKTEICWEANPTSTL